MVKFMCLQNLHTHTSYCDGIDTPSEIVITALEKKFTSIGFSGHSYMKYSPMFAKNGDETEVYKKNVLELKEKYILTDYGFRVVSL